MLTQQQNEELTRVGPGTPAGNLFRKYWTPIALSADLAETSGPLPVRALGENLVLFRDGLNRLGLVAERCPHRGTSLVGGKIENEGIRCCYHGWMFNCAGQCVQQPGEPANSDFHKKVKIDAYPVQDKYGIIWAYMGEGEPPVLPAYDLMARTDGHRIVTAFDWECNYLQIAENLMDPLHTAVLHMDTALESTWAGVPEMRFEETSLGMRSYAGRPGYERRVEMLFPCGIRQILPFMNPALEMMFVALPVDDTKTISFFTWFIPLSEDLDQEQRAVIIDRMEKYLFELNPNERRTHSTKVVSQDKYACESQGVIVDRTNETLGVSDRGVIMMRKLYQEAINDVREGREPKGIIRGAQEEIIHFNVV